jgi:hypothetical protein
MLRYVVIAGVVAGAATLPAGAQTPQTSSSDTAIIRLGPLGLNPTLMLQNIGVDENVFNESQDPKRDFTFTLVPRIEVLFKPQIVHVAFTTATQYVYYDTYTSERSTNQSASVRVDFNLARLQPYVHASGVNTRERLNPEVDERARHFERILGGGLNVKIGTSLTIGAGARQTRFTYDQNTTFRGEDLRRSFNSTIDAYDASAGFQLTPFTSLTVTVAREDQRFHFAPERDSRSIRVTPTVSFRPEAVLNGAVSFGYRKFMPRTNALPAFSGLVATVNLGSTLWNRHRVEAVLARDIRYSYETDTPYYLATGATVTMTTQLFGPFDIRGTGSRQLLEYRGNRTIGAAERPGDDTATSYGFGVGYRIREHLRFGVNAEWSGRDSALAADREYRNRRIFASVTWGNQV